MALRYALRKDACASPASHDAPKRSMVSAASANISCLMRMAPASE